MARDHQRKMSWTQEKRVCIGSPRRTSWTCESVRQVHGMSRIQRVAKTQAYGQVREGLPMAKRLENSTDSMFKTTAIVQEQSARGRAILLETSCWSTFPLQVEQGSTSHCDELRRRRGVRCVHGDAAGHGNGKHCSRAGWVSQSFGATSGCRDSY